MLLVGVEDNLQHHFAPYRWPERFRGVAPDEIRRYRGILNAHHRRLDGLLAGLFELADERTVVLLVSDHGYRFLPDNPLTPEAHGEEGVLFALGGPVRAGASGLSGSVYDVAPTVLHLLGHPAPQGWSGRALTELFDDAFLARHPTRRE